MTQRVDEQVVGGHQLAQAGNVVSVYPVDKRGEDFHSGKVAHLVLDQLRAREVWLETPG